MVQALVEIDENTNRVLNVVKAKYGLRDKGEAIKLVVREYIEIENAMRSFSERVKIDMDEMDLLLWSRKTGKILKW